MSPREQWLEPSFDWAWPGQGAAAAAVEVLPPAWVPMRPRVAAPDAVPPPARSRTPAAPRRLPALLRNAALLGAAFVAFLALFTLLARPAPPRVIAAPLSAPAAVLPALPAPRLDAAGSAVAAVSYRSAALAGPGSFLVYLPPGYSRQHRYPVLYLLHGNGQHADSFLELGVQSTLDSLIGGHAIGPLIAVMINGGPGTNNWRGRYTSYVFEVQALVDRMLPTLAQRSGRAIAGFSMGGYGALDLALTRPGTFAVAESWLGFFDGLHPAGLGGLRAFLWGASGDPIANPSENATFAAQLRAAGADARSAVYSGSHDFATLRAHLVRMLTFAGDGLSPAR